MNYNRVDGWARVVEDAGPFGPEIFNLGGGLGGAMSICGENAGGLGD